MLRASDGHHHRHHDHDALDPGLIVSLQPQTKLVNTDCPKTYLDEARQRRVHAFHALTELVSLACNATVMKAKEPAKINTQYTAISITNSGHLQFDGYWMAIAQKQIAGQDTSSLRGVRQGEKLIAVCLHGLQDHLRNLDQAEGGRTMLGLVNPQTLAGMLWHLSRLCMMRYRKKKEHHVKQVAIDICNNMIIFLTKGLLCWFRQKEDSSTVELLACQPAGRRTAPLLVHNLMKKKKNHAQARAWNEDGLKILPKTNHERRTSTLFFEY